MLTERQKKHLFPLKKITKATLGYCPICEKRSFFIANTAWFRESYVCMRCFSTPRFRAFMDVLQDHFPKWRQMTIHESSPAGPLSQKIAAECKNYSYSQYFPEIPGGEFNNGVRCENLEQLTFPDESFDLFITQDVFEHVLHADLGFKEIARVLKPGGAHVFTIPWYHWKKTLIRAIEKDGEVVHLMEPSYHRNPVDPKGSLVVTEWGYEFADYIAKSSGLATTIVRLNNPHHGVDANRVKFIEIFLSYKVS